MEEEDDYCCMWSDGSLEIKRKSKHKFKQKPKPQKTPEDIIVTDLQGIFCKGRYRSWMLLPEYLQKNPKKQKDKKKLAKIKPYNYPSRTA